MHFLLPECTTFPSPYPRSILSLSLSLSIYLSIYLSLLPSLSLSMTTVQDVVTDHCVSLFQGKGSMLTWWLLGERPIHESPGGGAALNIL